MHAMDTSQARRRSWPNRAEIQNHDDVSMNEFNRSSQILVAEHDGDLRRRLCGSLDNAGYVVDEAGDGDAAIRICLEWQVDLVITNLVLPNRDGLALIMSLKKFDPSIPIIAMVTGRGGYADLYMHIAERIGADIALSTPLSGDQLTALVTGLVAKRLGMGQYGGFNTAGHAIN